MSARRAAWLVGGAFLAFAAWEAIQHVWFMRLPMATYHLVSLTVDLILVLLITLGALAIVRRHTQPEARRRAAQQAITTALAQDLRPHLVALLTQLRALQSAAPEGASEETRELGKQAEARAAVLLDMIEDLVAMAAEEEKPNPRCVGVSLGELVGQAVETFRTAAAEKGVEVEAEAPEGLVETCRAPDAMLRVVSGLLRHALDSTARGGRIEVRSRAEEGGRTVALSVMHTGEALLDHPADLEEVISGRGLVGLREVQALADALGGGVRYEPGPGANTFTLSLPRPRTGR